MNKEGGEAHFPQWKSQNQWNFYNIYISLFLIMKLYRYLYARVIDVPLGWYKKFSIQISSVLKKYL